MTEQTTTEVPALTLQDLTLIANIIDLSVQRGAFKGAEAATVGQTFDKLVALLKSLAPEKVNEATDSEEE
jgi:hypothetical protein